ncbi:MAG: hypothetical protein ACJ77K_06545 [Bacteroidia bacterium]
MCIYYQNRPELSYKSQEHVFPAAIGGIAMLPKGYVSDQFNNDISKLERIVIKESMVGFARELEGPGKRGKLSAKHATKSPISLIESAEERGRFALGYVQGPKTYEISNYQFNTQTGFGSFSFPVDKDFEYFKSKCYVFNPERLRLLVYEELPINEVVFGIGEGVEKGYDYFIAKNPSNEFSLSLERCKLIADKMIMTSQPQKKIYQPIVSKKLYLSIDQLRIYAKIAFNYLASIKGKEYVCDQRFDPIRNWISNGGENSFAALGNTESNLLERMGIVFPKSFHFLAIHSNERGLWAKVFLYNMLYVDVQLSTSPFPDIPLEGFLCDYKNKTEYHFREYLSLTK